MASDGRINLSDEQRTVVEHPLDGGNLLVLAAPGSGKTRVIVERIRWLIDERNVPAESILAMTFTRRAAGELIHRSRQQGLWTGTFHGVAVDIIFDNLREAGFSDRPRIYDEVRRKEAMARAATQARVVLPAETDERDGLLGNLIDWISLRKRTGVWQPWTREGFGASDAEAVAEQYAVVLGSADALDFDDLVLVASRLLREHDEIAAGLHYRLRHVFIDEFHDVSPEQLEMISLLAPPADQERQLLAVADPDQAIYGWRGADQACLQGYRGRYRARVRTLSVNYRSKSEIVLLASEVMRDRRQSLPVRPDRAAGGPVHCREVATDRVEAEAVRDLIVRLIDDAAIPPQDIGILYRTHKRAHQVEAALTTAGIPVWRVQPSRFFARDDVRETMRYLDLALDLEDEDFVGALNWPRLAVDELSMVALRREAELRGENLCTFARNLRAGTDVVTPLTRVAVTDLMDTVANGLALDGASPARAVINRLLPILTARRHPILAADRADLTGGLEWMDLQLRPELDALIGAIDAGVQITLVHDGAPDSVAAAVILHHAIAEYLGHPVKIAHADFCIAAAFTVDLRGARRPAVDGIGLGPRQSRETTYAVALQAWRLAQLVLMARERLDEQSFAMFDLETGSQHPSLAEIVDIAVQPVQAGREMPGAFESLVRASGEQALTAAASRVNGILWSDLRDAPLPAEALPQALAAIGDMTVVGHNIEQFDYPVLQRAALAAGLEKPRHHLIDTLPMARRLFPDERSHRLEDLAGLLGRAIRQEHRALPDARLNGRVFWLLLNQLRRHRTLDALPEALPLVTLGVMASGAPKRAELPALVAAGVRAFGWGQGHRLVERWATLCGARGVNGVAWLERQEIPQTEEDVRWEDMAIEWQRQVAIFESASEDKSIRAFLTYAALADANDQVPRIDLPPLADGRPDPRGIPASERVAMMSVHSAKGKEWPVVVLIGVEDGQFPLFNSEDIEEERRLLYVGLTRAMNDLWLFWPKSRFGYAKQISRFLTGMPTTLLDRA